MSEYIAEFKDVVIDYELRKYSLRAVNGFSLALRKGKITALVGESGSGKTTVASSLINCISEPGRVVSGQVLYFDDNRTIEVNKLNEKELNAFRWEKVSMVFQGAQSALNPVIKIFDQFYETMFVHNQYKNKKDRILLTKEVAKKKMVSLLEFVNLDPERVLYSYPHELSGGMKQRVMIAFALLCDPKIIILDEPTTALDVITQDFIFSILQKINREMGIAMLLLTHDIAIVSKYADYLGVMYGGRLMEYGTVEDVFEHRYHPYTKGLIDSTPSIKGDLSHLKPIEGVPPDLLNMPKGCKFNPRCDKCMNRCKEEEPTDYDVKGSLVKCFLYDKKAKEEEQ